MAAPVTKRNGYDLSRLEETLRALAASQSLLPQFFNIPEQYGFRRNLMTFINLDEDFDIASLISDAKGYKNFLELFLRSEETHKLSVDDVKAVILAHPFLKDLSGPRGNTLLYTAARFGYNDVVHFLLEELGCDVNATGVAHGSTPMHGACYGGNKEAVQLLLKHNPNILAINDMGETVSQNLEISNCPEATKKEIRSMLKARLDTTPSNAVWEYQKPSASGEWNSFPSEEAQLQLASSLENQTASVVVGREQSIFVDLLKFVCDFQKQHCSIRCRSTKLPRNTPVSFQIQGIEDWQWRNVSAESHKSLFNAFKQHASSCLLEKEKPGLKMAVKLKDYTVEQEGKFYGYFRWCPLPGSAIQVDNSLIDDAGVEEVDFAQRIPHLEEMAPRPPHIIVVRCQVLPEYDWVLQFFPMPVYLETATSPTVSILVHVSGMYNVDDVFRRDVDLCITKLQNALAHSPPNAQLLVPPDVACYPPASKVVPEPPTREDLDLPDNSLLQKFFLSDTNPVEQFVSQREQYEDYRMAVKVVDGGRYVLRVHGNRAQVKLTKSIVVRVNYFVFESESLKKSSAIYLSQETRNSMKMMTSYFNTSFMRQKEDLEYISNVFLSSFEKRMAELCSAQSERINTEMREFLLKGMPSSRSFLEKVVLETSGQLEQLKKELHSFAKNQRRECEEEWKKSGLEILALEDAWNSLRKKIIQAKVDGKSVAILEQHLKSLTQRVPPSRNKKKWTELPGIIVAGMTQAEACGLNLPLYARSRELLDIIRHNDVVSVHTGTGTGKSTLLPPLLIAERDYKRIAVTQPRRLPCRNVCNRVLDTFSHKMAGWAVSGDAFHPERPIIYLTDGLLREWLQSSLKLGLDDDNQQFDFDVVILDEVHERGWNTDICIALLAQILLRYRKANKQLKIILASATLDDAINRPFVELAKQGKLKFQAFDFPLKSPFPVNVHQLVGHNPVDLVVKLAKEKKREEQILVFMASVAEVRDAVNLFNKLTGSVAYGLYANQDPSVQRSSIAHGSVFFSTTIAETSLTFPHLRYVIDTGEINILQLDHERRLSKLATMPATESTILQRQGRLGRTCEGDYYKLFENIPNREKYAKPQLLSIDLADVEFSLRLREVSLRALASYLPSPPASAYVSEAVNFLVTLGLCNSSGNVLDDVKILPTMGTARMTASVLAGLQQGCGCDMIYLAAIILCLPSDSTLFLKALPPKFRSESDGDLMSLLKLMYELVRQKKQSVGDFNVREFARSVNMNESFANILSRSLEKLAKIENRLEHSKWKFEAQKAKHAWEPVCKALLAGYSTNIFCSQQILFGNKAWYSSFGLEQNTEEQVGLLSFDSCLTRRPSDDPVPWIIAMSVFITPMQSDYVMLSMAGRFDPSWAKHSLIRHVNFTGEESALCTSFTSSHSSICTMAGSKLCFKGSLPEIAETEAQLYAHLTHHQQVIIRDNDNPNLKKNLEDLRKNAHIFHTFIWKVKNESQVEIKMKVHSDRVEFDVQGRRKDVLEVVKSLNSFGTFLRDTTVLTIFDAGNFPQRVDLDDDTRKRLRMVTDDSLTEVDLWKMVRGADATRETRMAAIAWIAVTEFDCRLEGGFVRDWVVRGEVLRPSPLTPPASWLEFDYSRGRWEVVEGVIPSDLDIELPFKFVPLDRFRNRLHKFGFATEVQRFPQGYNLVIDRAAPTGPFTLDLIYPHNVVTHDRVDFDVNNLYCMKSFTHEFGLRIDVSQSGLTLNDIVENVKAKQLFVMKTEDPYGIMGDRIQKMKARGWNELGRKPLIPNRGPKAGASFALIASKDPLYVKVHAEFSKSLPGKTIESMKLISTFNIDLIYQGIKQQIELENNGEANETLLFHGTRSAENVQSIMDKGFDDRYWNLSGLYGAGAYFADEAKKSHDYTEPTASSRYIFWVKVLLGKEEIVTSHQPKKTAPSVGYHSVRAEFPSRPKEFIVYRYGQAKPFVLIQYKD